MIEYHVEIWEDGEAAEPNAVVMFPSQPETEEEGETGEQLFIAAAVNATGTLAGTAGSDGKDLFWPPENKNGEGIYGRYGVLFDGSSALVFVSDDMPERVWVWVPPRPGSPGSWESILLKIGSLKE